MDEEPESDYPLFIYQREGCIEGIIRLMTTMFVGSGLLTALWYIDDRENPLFYLAYLILIPVMLLGLYISIRMIGAGGMYRFVVFADRIACESPDETLVHSFVIPAEEIVELEEDKSVDAPSWTIITESGARFMISPNYSAPVQKIARNILYYYPHVQHRFIP